jgi:hypothetical protein
MIKEFKYCIKVADFGFPNVSDIKEWVAENNGNRSWGNLGYVSCNSEEDAIMVVLKWS